MEDKKLNKELKELMLDSGILEDFKSLYDFMSFENVLCEKVINIINKYISYDVAGVFFNESDDSSSNMFYLSLPNNNISLELTDKIRDVFFDEMEKYKRVNEIQCNLVNGDVVEQSDLTYDMFKSQDIIPYKYADHLSGGLYIGKSEEFTESEKAYLKIIEYEMEVVFKLRYLFNEQARHAFRDPMTGLYNRQLFDANLENEFFRARRYIFNFTLVMLDVDYLSKINEEYGREFGDFVIQELGEILKKTFRRTDLVYRYGGEEIIIFLPSTPITKALIPIERLRANIASHLFEKNDVRTNVTVSVGLCANYSKFTEPNQLLDGLGTALLRAKERGRNTVDIFE